MILATHGKAQVDAAFSSEAVDQEVARLEVFPSNPAEPPAAIAGALHARYHHRAAVGRRHLALAGQAL